jgi:uncharacterized protein involved in exopolysaccharide biosynthesis
MELQDLLSVITRRFWVVIIGTALAVAGSYLALSFFAPPPLYEATAAVLIGSNEDLDLTSLEMGRELAPTYVEWARRRPVLQAAIDNLEMPLSFEELQDRVRVRAGTLSSWKSLPRPPIRRKRRRSRTRSLGSSLNSPFLLTGAQMQLNPRYRIVWAVCGVGLTPLRQSWPILAIASR